MSTPQNIYSKTATTATSATTTVLIIVNDMYLTPTEKREGLQIT